MPSSMLKSALADELPAAAAAGLDEVFTLEGERLLGAFVGAMRRAGREPLERRLVLPGPAGTLETEGWSRGHALRVALLLSSQERGLGEDFLWRAYREGDSAEKAAVLSSLPLLLGGGAFVELALDAGRTNEVDLFAALACDNPFPAAHYPRPDFNQLVMKAAFSGLALERIRGLAGRSNPELARMAMDYVDERQAAGRPVPADIWLAMGPEPPPGAVARMLGALHHAVAETRRGAALALSRVHDSRVPVFLEERLELERDPEVLAALRAPTTA